MRHHHEVGIEAREALLAPDDVLIGEQRAGRAAVHRPHLVLGARRIVSTRRVQPSSTPRPTGPVRTTALTSTPAAVAKSR
jgi:hypothetical protein